MKDRSIRILPTLHSLRAFEAAARHLHFGKAALELGLDPTAISHQVRKLEESVGVALFIRRPRPLRLTKHGEELYPEIRAALDRMADAVARLRQDRGDEIVVSMTMAFAAEWFTPRLNDLKSASGLEISVNADNRALDLHAAGIDLALRSQDQPGAEGIWRRLFEDRLIVVSAPRLITDKGVPRDLEELRKLPLIRYSWTNQDRSGLDWENWFANAGGSAGGLSIAATFSEESHAIQAALSGVGAALLSERIVSRRLQSGELIQLSDHNLIAPAFWAVYRSDHPRATELEMLIEHICK
jgi:LysR family glycine cleavage system transcriptional activator